MPPPRRDDHDDREEDDQAEPLSPEERWSHVYYAGRRDGAHEARVNHRLDAFDARLTKIEDLATAIPRYLFGLFIAAGSQIGLMLIGIATAYFTK